MIPVATAQAYNRWKDHSLYDVDYNISSPVSKVSFDRPGSIMAGGAVGGAFGGWEEKLIFWLEIGYVAHYCTSIDLHEDPSLLSTYRLLVIVGHDEYWSRKMRDHAEAFVTSGGNIAVFGGNTCCWQVRFENNNRTMVCYKWNANDDPLVGTDRLTTLWDPWWYSMDPAVGLHQVGQLGVELPSNPLIGVGFRYGAFASVGRDPSPGYEVQFPDHWVFKNTGLAAHDVFGTDSQIVGYETDAADFQPNPASGVPEVTGSDGTPRNFVVLATAKLYGTVTGDKHGNATLGLFLRRGVVFNAATINWSNGLQVNDTVVQQVTRNVLDRLSCPDAGSPPLQNSEFQVLDGWVQERSGEYKVLSGAGAAPVTRSAAPLAPGALCIDATGDQIWVSQVLELLHGHTCYRIGCWVKASGPGALIALQRTAPSWVDFAVVEHSGSGTWQFLSAIGKVDDGGPLFQARVRLQVSQGKALFTRVTVTAL